MNSHCAIGDEWLLSQHLLGWPSFRPRLYTILVRKESGFLDGPKLNLVNSLYRQPSTCSRDLFCAPADAHLMWEPALSVFYLVTGPFCCWSRVMVVQEEVEAHRESLAEKCKKSRHTKFVDLLSGGFFVQIISITIVTLSKIYF